MKKSSIIFLQAVIVLAGIGVLILMLLEPRLEGRNAHATLFETYFHDPFLAYAYIGSISFFTALCQAFKLLRLIGRNKVFSLESVKALRTIKYCGITLAAFVVGAEAYMWAVVRGTDDIVGGAILGILMIFGSAVVAAAAAVFESLLRRAMDIQSENELAV